jgi:hypothetical protein
MTVVNFGERNARLDNPFEHMTENISLAEGLVAAARKFRMIRDMR